jgi:hypothetical protein
MELKVKQPSEYPNNGIRYLLHKRADLKNISLERGFQLVNRPDKTY